MRWGLTDWVLIDLKIGVFRMNLIQMYKVVNGLLEIKLKNNPVNLSVERISTRSHSLNNNDNNDNKLLIAVRLQCAFGKELWLAKLIAAVRLYTICPVGPTFKEKSLNRKTTTNSANKFLLDLIFFL